YFKLIGEKIEEYLIEPENIYNIDEKGFIISILRRHKRVFEKGSLQASIIARGDNNKNNEQTNTSRHYSEYSPSGWTNNDVGLSWVEEVFDRETKKKAR
ncbi:hypothetical protein DM02DRAFT_478438, partial [Periconia macrospinosa]